MTTARKASFFPMIDSASALMAQALQRHWKKYFVVAASAALVGGSVGRLFFAEYSSESYFYLNQVNEGIKPGVSALIGQLGGLGTGQQSAMSSPKVVAQIATSDTVLLQVIRQLQDYQRSTAKQLVIKVPVADGKAPDYGKEMERAIRRLRKHISTEHDIRTGLVRVAVQTRNSELSQFIAARLVQILDRQYTDLKRNQAGSERLFAEEILQNYVDALRSSESKLETFLENNRDPEQSPRLRFQKERLQREIDLKRELTVSITQIVEDARLREIRRVPSLVLMQEPRLPNLPSSSPALQIGSFLVIMTLGIVALIDMRNQNHSKGERDSAVTGKSAA